MIALLDCKRSKLGTEYLGHEAITKSRRTCQEWSTISHKFQQADFPDVSIEAAGNKCRNPDNEPNGPWCYVMNPNMDSATPFIWEYCDIPMCLGNLRKRLSNVVTAIKDPCVFL